MTPRRRKMHKPERIVAKLRDADAMVNAGKDRATVLLALEISEATLIRSRAQYGGMKSEEARRLKVLEDEILEALERVDGHKATQPPIEAELAAAKAALEEIKVKVQAERGALDTEVARIAADLERAEQELPTEARESYRRMVRSKGADAMAQLDGESCGGCCQQLPPNAVAELSQGRVVPCRSCGRMVYASRSD